MLINNEVITAIESIIFRIESEYQHNQGLILTESDAKCLLFSWLKRLFLNGQLLHGRKWGMPYRQASQTMHQGFPMWRCPTLDLGIYASPIHVEVPWYDEYGRLAIRPDITVLEPKYLSIIHGLTALRLPSKQFEFGGQGIIFEIKFCRSKSGITKQFLKGIQKDFDKIERLLTRLRNQGAPNGLFCFYVIFNKTNHKCREFTSFLNQNQQGSNYKLKYCTGLVRW